MKLLVIGLDCAAPELLLEEPKLTNFRRLMDAGCYGKLESVIPPITVPAWMCMSTSHDPGTLGVYGFRNRKDYSYSGLATVDSRAITDLAIWDQIAREGKKAHVIGVPPNYPPRKTSGYSVGCFLTPDPTKSIYTRPEKFGEELHKIVGGTYHTDVKGFRTNNKQWLKDEIWEMTRGHFAAIRHVMKNSEWDYLQFVEIGLDRMHHGFWKHHDPQHRQHVPGPFLNTVRDYYQYLDEEIGSLLELLDEETGVLVLSDHGAQRLDGGFCVNEWLIQEGLLKLNNYPDKPTDFADLDVDWAHTTAWGEGGYYSRIFLNVQGREPQGTIPANDLVKVRDDIKHRLEQIKDDRGQVMGTKAYIPAETYHHVKNVPPELVTIFGGLYWRSIGKVGYKQLHIQENDTGPDDCNHAQFGAFILALPNSPLQGKMENVHLLDLTPTLLEAAGYDGLPDMQGKSLLSRPRSPDEGALSDSEEQIIRQRLSGLGYI